MKMTTNTHDAIIIGAGFGGAACAALLAKRGFKVLLVEKNNLTGGKAMTLNKKGFTYSAWPVMGAPVMENKCQMLVDALGVGDKVTLTPSQAGSFYKTPEGKYEPMPEMGGNVDPVSLFGWLGIGMEEFEKAMTFFGTLIAMPPEMIDGFEGTDFDSFIKAADLPRSLYAFIVSLCLDGMFMVPVDKLDAAEAIYSLQDIFIRSGGLFCVGGYGKLSDACLDVVRDNGGQVLMHTRVNRILVDNGQAVGIEVTGKDGSGNEGVQQFRAPVVISNAGIQPTVLKLAGEANFPAGYVARIKDLVPSEALLGYRYFLKKPITDKGFGVVFSQTSPWNTQRLQDAHAGKASREGVLYFEVPNNYDASAAPEGKQVIVTGSFCPPDPDMSKEDIQAWADAGEEIFFGLFPEARDLVEEKDLYTTKSVSNATRDATMPGTGGETIGLAQIVGQCGKSKPSIETPLKGLYLVGCDAGARGIGTQQAIQSGFVVADAVEKRLRG
jgi:prolycopene isomerase